MLLFLLVTFALSGFSYADGGFFSPADMPDSVAILAAPPEEQSSNFERDKAVYKETRALRGTPRWDTAAFDADLSESHFLRFYDKEIGITISKEKTPYTYALLTKVFNDFGSATAAAKQHYMRTRPFVYFKDLGPTCAPQDEAVLSQNGSYPSGHTSIGYGFALVLAQAAPEKQNEILKRGYEFGQSRVVCGAHWQSDVDAGRLVAAAVFARLQNNKEYLKLVKQSAEEIRKALKENKRS